MDAVRDATRNGCGTSTKISRCAESRERTQMNQLKASPSDPASDAILVSFHSKWRTPLESNRVTVFLRKRGPRSLVPKWAYVYLCTPACCVVGRVRIHSHRSIDAGEASALTTETCLSVDEISRYLDGRGQVDAFFVGPLEVAPIPAALDWLRKTYGFHPPQSFLILSPSGRATLDLALNLTPNPVQDQS